MQHRPDIDPGPGWRILEVGETLTEEDQTQDRISVRPFRLAWVPVAPLYVGRAVDQNWTACRTRRPLT